MTVTEFDADEFATKALGSREEYLALCKKRALAYLDTGDLRLAWLSMTADMRKHPGTDDSATSMLLADLGLPCVEDGNADGR